MQPSRHEPSARPKPENADTPDVWREIQTWADQSRSRPAGTQVCRVMYKGGVVEVRDLIGPDNMGIAARRMMGYK